MGKLKNLILGPGKRQLSKEELDNTVDELQGLTLSEVEQSLSIAKRRDLRRRGGYSRRRSLYVELSPEERSERRKRVDRFLDSARRRTGD